MKDRLPNFAYQELFSRLTGDPALREAVITILKDGPHYRDRDPAFRLVGEHDFRRIVAEAVEQASHNMTLSDRRTDP